MNMPNLRWPVAVLTMVIALTALFGVGFAFKNQTVDGPLKAAIQATPKVESYRVERSGDEYEITVLLADSGELDRIYTALDKEIVKILGPQQPYQIKLEDRRTAELEDLARRANLYVHEALMTGHFSAMADKVEAVAASLGATARMSVDGDRVYVQIHKQGNYLYTVLEREKYDRALRPAEGGIGL